MGLEGEGSVSWNSLGAIGMEQHGEETQQKRKRLSGLKSLTIVRGAATGKQLEGVVRMNPELKKVRLGLCVGVERELVQALGQMVSTRDEEGEDGRREATRAAMKVLELDQCGNLVLKTEEDFAWIDQLVVAGLEELSLRECDQVDGEMLKMVAEERTWRQRGLWRLVGPNDDVEAETKSLVDEELSGTECVPKTVQKIEVDPAYA